VDNASQKYDTNVIDKTAKGRGGLQSLYQVHITATKPCLNSLSDKQNSILPATNGAVKKTQMRRSKD